MPRTKSLFVPAALLISGCLCLPTVRAQGIGCYTLASLQGNYAVVVNYGANVALGLQPETLDGQGNLSRTGINNQPTAGSTTGARTISNVTSTGTYTVNCNGSGTITRLVTRADGTTATAADDFVITESSEKDGRLIATTIVDAQRDPSVIVAGGIFVTRTHTRLPDAGKDACYTLASLQGSYGVAVMYGANVALGLQPESLDGEGNLFRTGINNQPVAGSATGARTVGTVTSRGTFTVNCNGTGAITRIVTRPDGTTGAAVDDFLITAATEKGGLLTANRIVDAQRDPALVGPTPTFITRTHTLRAIPNPKLNDELQLLACGSHSPTPSCQVSVSVWNYYLNTLDFKAPPLMFGDGTELMTVNRYWGLRAVAGL
ncbi:MAG: hypothetical protein IPP47_07520 [Bryobacterales bacterium]|nr:hypothetical protein [Bryobacterales bacterium]